MKQKNWIDAGWLCVLFGALCIGAFLYSRKVEPSSIFHQSVRGIVELKAGDGMREENYGTAVFLDQQGTLITNAHIVVRKKEHKYQPYKDYAIRFASEEGYHSVRLVRYDMDLDLAVLQLENQGVLFQAVTIGKKEKIDYGDSVYAVGNAMNYGISMEQGIISRPNVKLEYAGKSREVIQCDMNITSGNSGGALLDENGKLIGITTFRTKNMDGTVVYGLAYAIPIYTVLEYVGAG